MRNRMAVKVSITVLCFLISLCSVTCELNLSDGLACDSDGLNGTCVSVYRCPIAALSFIYRRAGFVEDNIPELPEICSYDGEKPIVCCTDCKIHDDEVYKDHVVLPRGINKKKEGPKSLDRCWDYFQYLPYNCRGIAGVKITAQLHKSKTCRELEMSSWLGIGGRNAERWEFPHMALLGFGEQQDTKWLCGGTIISEKFILTAAHCVSSAALGPVTFAALGLLKRSDPIEYWNILKIKRGIRHPEYKPPSKYHDIALLETETEIKFSDSILPACLHDGSDRFETSVADASGWGQVGRRNPLADTLQVMKLNRFDDTECSSLYPEHRLMKRGYDNSTQMCYGSHQAVIDTCQGDSGGPLQINMGKCLYTVVGVTSFGKECGYVGTAGIYTRVSYYVPWIESIVWAD